MEFPPLLTTTSTSAMGLGLVKSLGISASRSW